jgi:nucleotide-binding universal stress UspA family protein
MYKRIMVSIDGSDTSTRALREAIRIGKHQQAAQIRLLHIVDTISYVPQDGSGLQPSFIKELYTHMDRSCLNRHRRRPRVRDSMSRRGWSSSSAPAITSRR